MAVSSIPPTTAISPFNLTYQWVEFPSENLLRAVEYLSYTDSAISLTLYTLTVWVVIRRSPPVMGPYRWYLLFNVTVSAILVPSYALVRPQPLLPYPIVLYSGLLSRLAPFPPLLLLVIQVAWTCQVVVLCSSIVVLFIYRLCHLSGNWLYRHLLRNVPLTVGLCLLISGVCGSTSVILPR